MTEIRVTTGEKTRITAEAQMMPGTAETLTIPEEPEESEESENSEETENAGAEEEAEIRTVKLDPVAVQPEGSFEIEIKGLGADGGTNVWHFGESGMEELAAKALPDGMTFRVWPE